MGGDHDHGAGALRAGARHQKRLAISFVLILVFFVVEAVAGVLTNSLALLSDAGHMLTDVVGLGMALAAIQLASRHAAASDAGQHTFGLYRLEILAAFVNSLLLFGVAIYVLVEAVRRLTGEAEVLGVPMLVVATLGLVVNLISFALLRQGSKESINVEGAYLEVLADTLGSVGVIIAAVLLEVFGWDWVDPVIGAAIGLWILPRTWHLGSQAVRILLQAAPPEVDLRRPDRGPGGPARRGRGPRPARVDPHLGHGERLGPPRRGGRHRCPRRARPGPGPAPRRVPHRPRHPPGRAGRPPGLRRGQLVTSGARRGRPGGLSPRR